MINIDFTRDDLNTVARVAQQAVVNDAILLRAIDRALVLLGANRWSYDGRQVIIHSTSGETYHITTADPMRCTCKGRQKGYKCKHIVAARLLVRAAEYHAAQSVAMPRIAWQIVEVA